MQRRNGIGWRLMSPISRTLFAATLCLALVSCGLVKRFGKKKEADKPEKSESQVIGVIEMVNPEQRFVLIRTESRMTVAAGQEITAVDSAGVESKLKVTPEKKQHYLTADVLEGNPKTGHLVIHRRPVGAEIPTTPVTPPVQPSPSDLVPLPAVPDQPPPLPQSLQPISASPIPAQPQPPAADEPSVSALPPVVR